MEESDRGVSAIGGDAFSYRTDPNVVTNAALYHG